MSLDAIRMERDTRRDRMSQRRCRWRRTRSRRSAGQRAMAPQRQENGGLPARQLLFMLQPAGTAPYGHGPGRAFTPRRAQAQA